jgi:hypothetical protein
MKRLIAVLTVSVISVLGLVGATTAAEATVPTNGRIAFGEEGPDEVLVVASNPDGTHRQELVQNLGCLSWSPVGTKLLVCVPDDRGLARPATIDADGKHFTILDNPNPMLNLFCWAWSPDGTRLACEGGTDPFSDRDGIYTVRSSDGGGLIRLTSSPPGSGVFPDGCTCSYSPDGSRVAFTRWNPKGQSAIFTVKTDGAGIHQVTPWGLGGIGGNWSRDGQWIVLGLRDFFNPWGQLSSRGRVFLVHPDGGGLHKIDIEISGSWYFAKEPTWSPDGTRILFVMYLGSNGGQPDLFTMNPDGSHVTQVTDTPVIETTPSWGTYPLAS